MESISEGKKNKRKILKIRKRNAKIALVFFCILASIFLIAIFSPEKKVSKYSDKKEIKAGKLTPRNFVDGKFGLENEKYVNDKFALNGILSRINSSFTSFLGQKERNGVYKSDDSFLIENFDTPNEDVMNIQVAAINNFFSSYKDCSMSLIIVPTKAEILKEKLPSGAYTKNQADYIKLYNKSVPNLKTVNLIEILNNHRDEYIYYKTDSNWTSLGSYYSYKEVANKLGLDTRDDKFKACAVSTDYNGNLSEKSKFNKSVKDNVFVYFNSHSEFESLVTYSDGTKKATMYDKGALDTDNKLNVFFGKEDKLVRIDSTSMEPRKLLVIGDSYAKSFVPFLAEHYETIFMVDPSLYKSSVKELMDKNKITDVMILYSTINLEKDRNLENLLDVN